MLSLFPPPSLVSPLWDHFRTAALELDSPEFHTALISLEPLPNYQPHSLQILEPLISLIVDHSVARDSHWPTMLSALIQAGVVRYLVGVATLPLPLYSDGMLWRIIHNAKRDALIGIVWCFELMLAKDIARINRDALDALESLSADGRQPMSVQGQAKRAIETWDK